MTNSRLADFHPLPKGLARDRRYRKLSLVAARLLVDAHMTADETESDGLVDEAEFVSLAALARIPAGDVEDSLVELVNAGFLIAGSADDYLLVGFRGLSHDAREANREAARERQRKHRTAQSDYQMSQRDERRESQPPEREGEKERDSEKDLPTPMSLEDAPTTPSPRRTGPRNGRRKEFDPGGWPPGWQGEQQGGRR